MKVYGDVISPYVRKAVITAIEAGLDNEVERITPVASVWVGDGDAEVAERNPLGKVPTLVTREDTVLIDSTLICEYLASLAPDVGLLPAAGPEHWRVLHLQALAQGFMDAMVFRLLETQVRPEQYGWDEWIARQSTKIARTMDSLETMQESGELDGLNLGTITLGCALGYLVQRTGETSWREDHPSLSQWFEIFSQREAMQTTMPTPLPPPHLDPRRQANA